MQRKTMEFCEQICFTFNENNIEIVSGKMALLHQIELELPTLYPCFIKRQANEQYLFDIVRKRLNQNSVYFLPNSCISAFIKKYHGNENASFFQGVGELLVACFTKVNRDDSFSVYSYFERTSQMALYNTCCIRYTA